MIWDLAIKKRDDKTTLDLSLLILREISIIKNRDIPVTIMNNNTASVNNFSSSYYLPYEYPEYSSPIYTSSSASPPASSSTPITSIAVSAAIVNLAVQSSLIDWETHLNQDIFTYIN